MLEVGLEQIGVAVEVEVAEADAHAAHLLALGADRDAAKEGFFAEGAVVVVHEQQAGRGIAGDEDSGQPSSSASKATAVSP